MRSFEIEGSRKEEIRDLIVFHAKTLPTPPHLIFTLPGREMLDVKLFSEHFPETPIIGIEQIPEDFEYILQNVPRNLTPYQTTIREYSQSTPKTRHHSVVFLDYLGALTDNKRTEIRTFVQNDSLLHSNKETILAITLAKANRNGGSEETLSFVEDLLEPGEDPNTLLNIETIVCSDLQTKGVSVELLECFEYVNSKGAMPMFFFLYRIMKK